jgi:Asp-tRNA(Asn)/Glu-tRNA(Gln) amidotransferase A subunit family amidase
MSTRAAGRCRLSWLYEFLLVGARIENIHYTRERQLDGLTIGVVREYMDKGLFTKMDHETIDIVDRAVGDLKSLGARIVDPVGIDFVAPPFGEPTLLRIASAYEAATKHRRPPRDFGPLPGEP